MSTVHAIVIGDEIRDLSARRRSARHEHERSTDIEGAEVDVSPSLLSSASPRALDAFLPTRPVRAQRRSRFLFCESSEVGWDARRRMQLALTLLADPVLDVLITGESEFEALPETMARLAKSAGDTLCHRIRYA